MYLCINMFKVNTYKICYKTEHLKWGKMYVLAALSKYH